MEGDRDGGLIAFDDGDGGVGEGGQDNNRLDSNVDQDGDDILVEDRLDGDDG